ncbi:MFS transporter [Streptomyces sp. TRM 70351]|uniref:MFS transporter n=1 Tax=Streptomyces sp. TRM 70351 TaxID=3116552 RepID=UPI002E7B5319|nr:MFS transporter [Streptomyces sp. TRM 70351]MEE1928084.1 MFS transporter [Streptomyces sp. TRM 70351]
MPPSPAPPSAPPSPPRRRRPSVRTGPYARLFAAPGTAAFTAGGLLARLPMGMFTVSTVLMIAATRGSYALAGAVTATGLAATAVVAPLTARLVDRLGQARVAVPAVLLAVAAHLLLALCVRTGAPDWTLFACYAATATAPNLGGMARARWAHLHAGDAALRHTANSFEQAADELCFMSGPVLATFLCVALFPEAGTLTAAALLLGGTLLFAAQRRTEPPLARPGAARGPAPLRRPGMPALLVTFLATGAVFGALEVVTVAFADERGRPGLAGAVLGLQAAGSCVAGLLYGLLRPAAALRRRFAVCVTAMAGLMTLPLLAAGAGGLAALAPALLVAGMATAPTMATGMGIVQATVSGDRLNEGMTLAVTALLGGIACGAASGGWAAEHLGGAWGYTVPAVAATLAAATAVPWLSSTGWTRGSSRGAA